MPASSDTIRRIIDAFEALPEDVRTLIPYWYHMEENDYVSAMAKTKDLAQEHAVVQKYLLDAYGRNSTFKDFDKALPNLTRIFDELGLDEVDNPFIGYIDAVLDKGSSEVLTNDNIVRINNWYSDKILDYNDISGHSSEGTNHPIFQKGLFDSSDPDTLMKSYKFLSDPSNVRRMNFNALASSPKVKDGDAVKDVADTYISDYISQKKISPENVDYVRRAFINNGDDRGKFRDPRELRQLLSIASREKSTPDYVSNPFANIKGMLDRMNSEDRAQAIGMIMNTYGNEVK